MDEGYLRSAYASIERIIPQYVESRIFNKVFVFNNNGPSPVCELSFDRTAACQLSASLCGQVDASMPAQQATVCLYDHSGPVDDITVPYARAGNVLTFKYSWIGLPDWALQLNGSHATQLADTTCAHAYTVSPARAGEGIVTLRIRIPESAVRCVASLPQAGSPFWRAQPAGQPLVLEYGMESWDDVCPGGQCPAATVAIAATAA